MTLKIISAEDILFEGEVKIVHLPGEQGAFTVLPHHLTSGKIGFEQTDGSRSALDVSGGIADIDNDIVSVCIY